MGNTRMCAVMMMMMMVMVMLVSVRGDPIPENAKISLRGVTILHMPYVMINDSVPYASGDSKPLVTLPLKGFIVDLMNELAAKGNFDYTLSLTPDGKYGVIIENGTKINGMLGEVVNENVDFAAADITVNEERKKFVDFTEPIMSAQLAAIVLRTNESENWMTIEDLLKPQGDDQHQYNITFGVVANGSTNALFRDSSDPLAKKIYARMQASPAGSMMRLYAEGIDRAATDPHFAMIVESDSGDYILTKRCNLKKITAGLDQLGERHYAIALRRGSPHLQRLNDAIRAASKDGTIERLRAKWWSNSCAMKGEVTVIEK